MHPGRACTCWGLRSVFACVFACVCVCVCVCVHAPRVCPVRVQVGLHCENGIFGALFALLLWEVTTLTRHTLIALATLRACTCACVYHAAGHLP